MRAGTATVSLTSVANESFVVPGSLIPWTVHVQVSDDDNYGLALICVDLTQDASNPELIAIPQADAVPEEMAFFDRPYGLANPPPPDSSSGYLGTPVNQPAFYGLSQIGGAQNTFGTLGKSGGTTADIVPGVGQSPQGQNVASGFIPAPQTPGTYRFRIESVSANTLAAVNDPPAFSPTTTATVVIDAFEIVVHVCRPGDVNDDNLITIGDLEEFVEALLDPASAGPQAVCSADINEDGVTDGRDVTAFVGRLTGGGVTSPPPPGGRPLAPPKE